jgi:solute carrier family 35 protein E3
MFFFSVVNKQICKVLTTPVIMVIQTMFYEMTFENRIKLSLVPVLIGVVIVSVTDVEVNFIGTVYALTAVFVTSVYQIVREI